MLNPSERLLVERIIIETGDPNLAVMVLFIKAIFPQLDMKALDYAGILANIDNEVVRVNKELNDA